MRVAEEMKAKKQRCENFEPATLRCFARGAAASNCGIDPLPPGFDERQSGAADFSLILVDRLWVNRRDHCRRNPLSAARARPPAILASADEVIE